MTFARLALVIIAHFSGLVDAGAGGYLREDSNSRSKNVKDSCTIVLNDDVTPQMHFDPKCIWDVPNAFGQVPKCISLRPKCIWGASSTLNAFGVDRSNSQMQTTSQMHFVASKCIRERPKWVFIQPYQAMSSPNAFGDV